MSKQCQQPQAHPDRCGCVREIAEHNAQAYAEAIAALSAKDARIAQMDALLRRAMHCLDSKNPSTIPLAIDIYAQLPIASQQQTDPCEDMAEQLERAEIRMMFGDAQEPATPSEDGGEVLEAGSDRPEGYMFDGAVIRTDSGVYVAELISYDSFLLDELLERAETLAQPARQVGDEQRSAGDAWLWHALRSQYGDESQAEEGFYAGWKARAALDPVASQVGGDEPWRDEDLMLVPRALLGAVRYALKNKKDAPNLYDQLGEYCYTARAALAPAALVMPERRSEDYPSPRTRDAWNAALDEVARLNRRAIPVGLLERIDRALEHARMFIQNGVELGFIRMPDNDTPDPAKDTLPTVKAAQNELRALLGKEES